MQIFATDLNEKAISRARSGIYIKSALQNVSQQRLKRFFIKADGQYQIVKAIRDMCIYAPHNLLKDPPFSRMDIISCQNVLIYLEQVLQNKIMHAFHYALKRIGIYCSGNHPYRNITDELRLRHKTGDYRVIDAIFRNLLDDPKINGIIANYRDITDRKNLEHQKDEFIGIASHELKTPVTSIKAYAQILQDVFEKVKDKRSAEMLEKMNGQVDKLTSLIIDLLDFTRIEGGKLKFREENYNLNDVISEMVEEMQRTTKQHKIEKKLDKSVQMYGDKDRTGQVLINLLNNAIKYSPKAKKIIVSSKVKKDEITICVEDFGIGIEKNHLEKVFERFFRVTESKLNTFPGLGLGLYIAAEIIKRQGGSINIKSTGGKGSVFCFTLPIMSKGKG